MSCQILVSNNSGTPKGEIITIQDSDFVFSENEVMSNWVGAGNPAESWSRLFSLVKVTDRNTADLKSLLEENDKLEKKYYLVQPLNETAEYKQLLETGEISTNFETLSNFLRVR